MNPKYHLLVAVAALGLGACSTDDTCIESEIGGQKITFTVEEDSETRITLATGDILRWLTDDEVGIYTVGKQNKNSNIKTAPEINRKPVAFTGMLDQAVFPRDKFYAYYPYNAAQSANPAAVKLSIPVEQTQTQAGVYNGASHPLVALPKVFPGDGTEGSKGCNMSNVRFRQLGAIVELQLYSSNEAQRSEKILSVKFESETSLAGDFTFDLTNVPSDPENKENLSISGYKSKEVTIKLDQSAAIPATKEEAALIYLTIAPGKYLGRFIVKTDITQYELVLKNPITFGRATIMGLPANLAKAKQIPIEFKDKTVEQICIANWDKDKDGGLSNQEAEAVTSIEEQFKGASIVSFNELQYFTNLQSIGSSAFNGCSSLTAITIPDGVTAIGSSAFNGCSSLTNIHIPDGVTAIEDNTFNGCSSLTSINIPDGVATIGANAFKGCSSLTSIRIPNGTIGANAFEGCENLTSVNMSEGVTTIGEAAFCNCGSLTSITIPKSVSSIGERVFLGCYSLSRFYGKYASKDHYCLINEKGVLLAVVSAIPVQYTIPDGVTTISDYVFKECYFINLTIPDGVKEIETHAFEDAVIKNLYCKPTTPPTLGSGAFETLVIIGKIRVPAGSVDVYKTAEGWSKYADQIFEE